MSVKSFKDFGIKSEIKSYIGEKIKMDKVLNREIIVLDGKVEPSNYKDKGSGNRVVLQIKYKEEMRVIFSGAVGLIDVISRLPKDAFPFSTTIAKDGERLEFT
jgi:hypothetical protein